MTKLDDNRFREGLWESKYSYKIRNIYLSLREMNIALFQINKSFSKFYNQKRILISNKNRNVNKIWYLNVIKYEI